MWKNLIIAILSLLILPSCKEEYRTAEFYDYVLRIYYLDGSTEVCTARNCVETPRIKAFRGTYWITFGNHEGKLGVDRFQILSKTKRLKKKLIEPKHYFFSPNTNKWELVTHQDSINLNIAP